MEERTLRQKTKNGLIWSSIERFGTQGVQFIIGVILARLLSPEAFGIIAMPMVFIALAQVFIDSGFFTALVRKPELKDEDLSTAFIFNIFVGVICYLLLFFLSPLIAKFYHTPALDNILKVIALTVLINPMATVQQAILTRRIDFRSQTVVSLLSAITAGLIGIWMAYRGYGIWALVLQQTATSALRVLFLWLYVKWLPKTSWSHESFLYLWKFGSKILLTGTLDALYNNIFPITIAKFYTANLLGNYTRAQQFADFPSTNITGILQRVTFPVLAKIQNDDKKLADNYRKFIKLSCFIIFPAMLGLASVSNASVKIVLGEQWEMCGFFLLLLCFAKMWYPVHVINLNVLHVKGRTDLSLRVELIKKIIGVIILCITIPNGITWMCFGLIIQSLIGLYINTYYTGVLIGVGFRMQMLDICPILCISISMFTILCFINTLIGNEMYILILDLIIGPIYYIFFSYLFKIPEITYLRELLRN